MEIKHKCGIFGLYSTTPSHNIIGKTIDGLENLQHRGREAAGISYLDIQQEMTIYKNIGLVKNIFKTWGEELKPECYSCIGHVRYSTTKKKVYKVSSATQTIKDYNEIQPLYSNCSLGEFSLIHNGNIPQVNKLANHLGISLETHSDSEIFIQLIKKSNAPTWEERLINIINNISGVYCLIIQTKDALYGLKDQFGIHPLCLAKNNNLVCLSSESTYLADCKYIRELNPGELLKIDNTGYKTIYVKKNTTLNFCLFEIIYFMKHTSTINNNLVFSYRYIFGHKLGQCEDIIKKNDIQDKIFVTSIPNTAIPSAKGYAEALNIKYMPIFKKATGTGRTFILPDNNQRYTTNRKGLIIKNDINLNLYNSIILVDDSLVRGNTIRSIIEKLKMYGVKNIHLRISSPPVTNPCYYGIDIPTKTELLAHNRTTTEIADILGITSLRYLDYTEMSSIFDNKICGSCFTGKYNELLQF